MSTAEQNMFPHATSEAAKTVAQHEDPQELIFYSGWFCPFVQRTWIALEERGIPYQYKEVNPYKKEAHFLSINPKGLVPAIEFRGKALYESLVLCEFLEDAYPGYTPHLLPSDPYERAHVRIWIDFISKAIIYPWMRILQSQEKEKQLEAREELYKALGQLSAQRKGPYFLGEQFSLVDVAIAPWAVREYILRENRDYKREDVPSGWKEWAELLEKRETVRKTSSDKEHYTQIYQRYLNDTAQSQGAKAIRGPYMFEINIWHHEVRWFRDQCGLEDEDSRVVNVRLHRVSAIWQLQAGIVMSLDTSSSTPCERKGNTKGYSVEA